MNKLSALEDKGIKKALSTKILNVDSGEEESVAEILANMTVDEIKALFEGHH